MSIKTKCLQGITETEAIYVALIEQNESTRFDKSKSLRLIDKFLPLKYNL